MMNKSIKVLTPYANNFFPYNFPYAPKLNINFTEMALHQMTPIHKAYKIALFCKALFLEESTNTPFHILEIFGGVGGNTMAFMQNESVESITTFECNVDSARMLRNNVEAISKTCQCNVTIIQREATLAELKALIVHCGRPIAIFADPPWGLHEPYTDPLRTHVNKNNETVLEWVNTLMDLPNVMFFMIKVPSKYELDKGLDTSKAMHHTYQYLLRKMKMLYFTHSSWRKK